MNDLSQAQPLDAVQPEFADAALNVSNAVPNAVSSAAPDAAPQAFATSLDAAREVVETSSAGIPANPWPRSGAEATWLGWLVRGKFQESATT